MRSFGVRRRHATIWWWRCSAILVATFVGAWPSNAPAATPASPSTAAVLSAGLIVPGDVPTGWTSTTAQKNPSLLLIKGIGPCAATRAALSASDRGARRAFSRKFVAPDQIGAAQDVVFVGRNDQATQRFATAYDGPQGRACVQAVAERVAKQASGTAVVTPLTDVATVGDHTFGYEFQITAPNHGALVTGVYDLVVARVGRAVCGFQLQNAIRGLPDRVRIITGVLARLHAAAIG